MGQDYFRLQEDCRQHGQKTGVKKDSIGIVLGKLVFSDNEIQKQERKYAEQKQAQVHKQSRNAGYGALGRNYGPYIRDGDGYSQNKLDGGP